MWALTAQLLGTTTLTLALDSTATKEFITAERGVPQGGVLSPILFTNTLDMILMKNSTIRKLIKSGNLCAFADDLIITTELQDLPVVQEIYEHLEAHGMSANPLKCKYLWHRHITALDGLAVWDPSTSRYLGKEIGYDSAAMAKSAKEKITTGAANLTRVVLALPTQPGRIVAMIMKSLLAFHYVPLVATGEVSEAEVRQVSNMAVKRAFCLPRTTPDLLIRTLLPIEDSWHWLKRITFKLLLKIS